MTALLNIV